MGCSGRFNLRGAHTEKSKVFSTKITTSVSKEGHIRLNRASIEQIIGQKTCKTLLDIPPETQKTIEIVDIFRPSEDVPLVIDQAIQLKKQHGKPYLIWMQLGITNQQAAEKAQKAELVVIMNNV